MVPDNSMHAIWSSISTRHSRCLTEPIISKRGRMINTLLVYESDAMLRPLIIGFRTGCAICERPSVPLVAALQPTLSNRVFCCFPDFPEAEIRERPEFFASPHSRAVQPGSQAQPSAASESSLDTSRVRPGTSQEEARQIALAIAKGIQDRITSS